jgi:hypothetical protein
MAVKVVCGMIDDFKVFASVAFALLFCLSGCGRRDVLMDISGTVTCDGQPVQKGTISLLPVNGRGPTAAAIIANGRYAMKAVPGMKQVKIESFKITGRQPYKPQEPQHPAPPMIDVQVQMLPERYNTKTELVRDIVPGVRIYNFTLTK